MLAYSWDLSKTITIVEKLLKRQNMCEFFLELFILEVQYTRDVCEKVDGIIGVFQPSL